jgi:APA family basic amino acid/polyamine antiporter
MAGLLTITGALCCSELATMMPRAGGVYVFFREAFGPGMGFLYGWTLFLVIQTGTIAAVAIAFAKLLGVFLSGVSPDVYLLSQQPISLGGSYAISLSSQQLVAIGLIALLTWTNTRGLKLGTIVQNTFTFAKTAALTGVVIVGLCIGWSVTSAARSSAWWNSWANGWIPQIAQPDLTLTGGVALVLIFGKSMVGPLFAQTAWTNVTFLGSEVRDPGRNLVRALLVGSAVVVVLYVLANVSYIALLPFGEIQHAPQDRVAVIAMDAAFGKTGALCMAGAIMISTFGCDNGLILSGARVYFAMARDGLFFKKTGTINRNHVPAAALIAQGIWTALLTLPRTVKTDAVTHRVSYGNVYTQLLEYIVSADLIFYLLMVMAVIVLRTRSPQAARPYRTWGYPIVPIVSMIFAAFLILDLVWFAPATSGIGIIIVLSGLPVYFLWSFYRRRAEF